MKSLSIKKNNTLYISFIISAFLFILSKEYGLFWDNILFGSKMGNELYNNGLFNWTMPDSFDPGHPPFLGFVLAFSWTVFEHKLWVAHLAMFPFTVGFLYQLIQFIKYFIPKKSYVYFCFLLILLDPTVGVTLILVNPEIIILFFFFLTMNSLLYKNQKFKFIGLFFLSIVSFRSMMLFGGIFLFEIFYNLYFKKEKIGKLINVKFLISYFISSIPGVLFVIWRLSTKGWLQTHPKSPWRDYWHLPDFNRFLKNIAVVIHRYIDFGRVFVILFIFLSLFTIWKKLKKEREEKTKTLFLIGFVSVTWIILACLFSTNAFGHRYFLVSYICLYIIAMFFIEIIKPKKMIFTLLCLGLISGNLWEYPKRISQGWNATLGHVPYHSLRIEAIKYLNNEKIEVSNVASFFPNYTTIDLIDLSGDLRSFSKFNGDNKYVFYSNVYNLTDEDYDSLDENYIEIKRFQKFHIFISIYQLKIK
tara:strand:+ start:250 stop:1671 length:1422 start_codon:yes stop_codon:yes gene_type:complete